MSKAWPVRVVMHNALQRPFAEHAPPEWPPADN
jgi:hypothetical protein